MLHELLRAAFVRCPERFPLDDNPEPSIDGSPRIPRAWWLYDHLSRTSAILSAQDGHEALQRFTALNQGPGIHSLSVFINAMNECRRILSVAPKAVVLTPYMLERQIKNGLNERCRVYARTVDFTEPIESIFQELTLQDSEWLQERGHPQPGLVTAKAPAGVAHATSYASAGGAPAELCSFCRDSSHCVDKCRKKAKVLATAQDAMEAERVARRKKPKGGEKGDSSGAGINATKKGAGKKGDGKKGDGKKGDSKKGDKKQGVRAVALPGAEARTSALRRC